MHNKTIIELEKSMIPVKQVMEKRGLNVDVVKLKALIKATDRARKDIEAELRDAFGISGKCNFNSSKDISQLLSANLGISARKTRTGRVSADRRFLRGIGNPLTDKIIRYRDLEQLLSSLKAIYKATDKAKGKIFCTYIDTCPSGRLYTKGYSFQSIPEAARSVIYADKGCSFILVDYDSFELRILSALSHDKYFKKCWDDGLDLHRKVVGDMKGIPYDSVTHKERKLGKALNFGLAYGQEAVGLARNLHMPVEQAQVLLENYKSRIPEIEAFKQEAIKKARTLGYCETYYGRRRLLAGLISPSVSVRRKAERRVINTMIQGTGADIVKFSLVNLFNAGFNIDTMLHDGILLTVLDNNIQMSLRRVKEIMEIEMEGMTFPVSCKTGKTWGECY